MKKPFFLSVFLITHLIVQEKYKIHLYKDERDSCSWGYGQKIIMAFWIFFNLKILAQFQTAINHAANTKNCKKKFVTIIFYIQFSIQWCNLIFYNKMYKLFMEILFFTMSVVFNSNTVKTDLINTCDTQEIIVPPPERKTLVNKSNVKL